MVWAMPTSTGRYEQLATQLAGIASPRSREDAMRALVDALWEAFGSGEHPAPSARAWSWVGFYYGPGSGAPGGMVAGTDEMILGYRRDKPACSPIGLHGMCGRSFLRRESIIVDDVATLGDDYVACDPRDVSELVVPMVGADGACWGVFDADSFARAAFDEEDARGVEALARGLGLTAGESARVARY